jgi:hypothetical protein
MEHSQTQWLEAIRRMTATPQAAAGYLDRRLSFTTSVAELLSHADSVYDRLVYGVWLEGHDDPIYIGQTTEGRRRLWDLPIGESHHLANSFPPEIWSRVVVVYWGKILAEKPELLTTNSSTAVGLGLEYLLQKQIQPLFNRRKKRRDGAWRDVRWAHSASIGAKAAPLLGPLFQDVVLEWNALSTVAGADQAKIEKLFGRVVFPSLLMRHRSESVESNEAAR